MNGIGFDMSQLYAIGMSYFNQALSSLSSYFGGGFSQAGSLLAISTSGLLLILFALLFLRRFVGIILSLATFVIMAELARRFLNGGLNF